MKYDKSIVAWFNLQNKEGKWRDVFHLYPKLHVWVRQVFFAYVYQPQTRVQFKDLLENSMKGVTKA